MLTKNVVDCKLREVLAQLQTPVYSVTQIFN